MATPFSINENVAESPENGSSDIPEKVTDIRLADIRLAVTVVSTTGLTAIGVETNIAAKDRRELSLSESLITIFRFAPIDVRSR